MKRRKVSIREDSWLARFAAWKLGADKVAIVVGHTIYLHNTTKAYFLTQQFWVRHELKHVAQYEQLGTMGFLWKYTVESYKNGYWENALEVEARAAERDDSLLERYDIG